MTVRIGVCILCVCVFLEEKEERVAFLSLRMGGSYIYTYIHIPLVLHTSMSWMMQRSCRGSIDDLTFREYTYVKNIPIRKLRRYKSLVIECVCI